MVWQPIETAPRDGTWFLIYNVNDGPESFEVGCYDELIHYRYDDVGDGMYRRQPVVAYEWRGFDNFNRATHWMPIPAPPTT